MPQDHGYYVLEGKRTLHGPDTHRGCENIVRTLDPKREGLAIVDATERDAYLRGGFPTEVHEQSGFYLMDGDLTVHGPATWDSCQRFVATYGTTGRLTICTPAGREARLLAAALRNVPQPPPVQITASVSDTRPLEYRFTAEVMAGQNVATVATTLLATMNDFAAKLPDRTVISRRRLTITGTLQADAITTRQDQLAALPDDAARAAKLAEWRNPLMPQDEAGHQADAFAVANGLGQPTGQPGRDTWPHFSQLIDRMRRENTAGEQRFKQLVEATETIRGYPEDEE